MMSLGDIAAQLPWPVFACDGEKRPIVATGFKAATRDHDTILGQFDRPGAVMIGVPTGAPSGLIAIDVDVKPGHDGRPWLDENQEALPPTRTHKTRSGGLHLLFRVPDGVEIRNSASRVASGVDVRGEGGYIIVPPSPGYAVADATEPADMPRWLIRACMREEAYQALPPPSNTRHERYVQAAIDAEVLAASRAAEGTRNQALNKAAFSLGTFVGAGQMNRSDAEAELIRAGQACGLPYREIAATIKSGLDAGAANPRQMPERRSEPQQAREAEPEPAHQPEEQTKRDETPALWWSEDEWDEATIPRRAWVVPGYLIRGAVTVLAGAGSSGKSSILKAWSIALALGRHFSRFLVDRPLRVLSYNVEDDLFEERRRMSAALRQFDASSVDIRGRVRTVGPHDVGTLVERDAVTGRVAITRAMEEFERIVEEFRPDVILLDPLVELHTAEENDNTGLRSVVAFFRAFAQRHNVALAIAHHTRKGTVTPGDPDAVRGAGAIVGAARVVFTVCGMTEEEANKTGTRPERRRFYFRLDSAKSNYAPIDAAEWFERKPYDLSNGETVAAAVPWAPPSPWDGITWAMIDAIVEQIRTGPSPGEFYSPTRQATHWVGNVVVEISGKEPGQAASIIKAWRENSLLTVATYTSPATRKPAQYLCVDEAVLSEMRLNFEAGSP